MFTPSISFNTDTPRFSIFSGERGFSTRKGGGTELGEDITRYITRVEWEDSVYGAAKLSLTVNNPDGIFSDFKVFKESNELELHGGYQNNIEFIGRGFIRSVEHNYPADGIPTIEIEAYDASVFLMEWALYHNDVQWINTTASAVADHIFNKHEHPTKSVLGVDIQPTDHRRAWVRKSNLSDFMFLSRLAKLHSYEWYTEYDWEASKWKGIFRAQKDNPNNSIFKFVYGREPENTEAPLFSFNPSYTTMDSLSDIEMISVTDKQGGSFRFIEEIKNKSRKKKQKKLDDHEGGKFYVGENANDPTKFSLAAGDMVTFSAFGVVQRVIVDKDFSDIKQAKDYLLYVARNMKGDFVLGTGDTIGNMFLRARQSHFLEVPGSTFTGKYYMTQTRHIFDNSGGDIGYKTEFDCRKSIDDDAIQKASQKGSYSTATGASSNSKKPSSHP